ncbi:hypothetical protein N7478_011138 [Penicillium angulare]|uniref:uncharacterized protein n=1 Tax=Penicillium angulare TaxID=116970 RepID=UPI00253FEFAE|nr:uncharacterized protein N7478_011138 [Penicillium angulare]KAJ5263533.1 hypothetical protein N7478_011138 [Penicillium angulare]
MVTVHSANKMEIWSGVLCQAAPISGSPKSMHEDRNGNPLHARSRIDKQVAHAHATRSDVAKFENTKGEK